MEVVDLKEEVVERKESALFRFFMGIKALSEKIEGKYGKDRMASMLVACSCLLFITMSVSIKGRSDIDWT